LSGASDVAVTCRGRLYLVTFVPHEATTAAVLAVTFDGTPIINSPSPPLVVIAGSISPANSTAEWPLADLIARHPLTIRMTARDLDGNIIACGNYPGEIHRFHVRVSYTPPSQATSQGLDPDLPMGDVCAPMRDTLQKNWNRLASFPAR